MWKRWDTLHLIDVAEKGYSKGPHLVIHPLYPWLVRACTWITCDYYISALLVSAVALVIAAVCLRRLVRLDYSRATALRAVWFLLIFPTAYFLHVGYTESLFLATVVASILAVRTGCWWAAGLLAGLAAITRATGIGLFAVLAIEAAQQWRAGRKWQWQWLWIFAVPAAYCVYLAINYVVAGDALAFFEARRQFFRTSVAWPWVGMQQLRGDLHRLPSQAEIVATQELIFVLLSLVATIASWIQLRPSYAMWMTFNWLAFAGQKFILSTPRYVLVLFPLFILFALWGRNRFWGGLITFWSLLYFAFFASLFARGWWAF